MCSGTCTTAASAITIVGNLGRLHNVELYRVTKATPSYNTFRACLYWEFGDSMQTTFRWIMIITRQVIRDCMPRSAISYKYIAVSRSALIMTTPWRYNVTLITNTIRYD